MDIRNLARSFFKRSEDHENAKPLFTSVFGHRSSSPKSTEDSSTGRIVYNQITQYSNVP